MGHAAFLDGKNVVQTQNYGPAARGSGASSEVLISGDKLNYPKVLECDVLVALSPGALRKHFRLLKPNGVAILDSGMIKKLPKALSAKRVVKVPATKLAEKELGSPIYTNIIALGTLTAQTKIVTLESMRKAIEKNVPPKMLQKNLQAFQIGLQW